MKEKFNTRVAGESWSIEDLVKDKYNLEIVWVIKYHLDTQPSEKINVILITKCAMQLPKPRWITTVFLCINILKMWLMV